MRITVLGKSPAWQDADGACSGYLVEDGGSRLLVDCGSGAFAKLRRFGDYAAVDAVVITHLHADHFFDLIPYACALRYGPRGRGADGGGGARPRLHVPPGAIAALRTIVAAAGQPTLLDSAFEPAEYDVAKPLRVGSLRVRFQPVPHYVPAHAIEVAGARGERFAYGSDHGPTDALDGFAADSELLILEATLEQPEREGARGHLTPAEAGEQAARCNAGRLVLSHISDELDAGWAVTEARRAFAGPVEVAREGAVYEI